VRVVCTKESNPKLLTSTHRFTRTHNTSTQQLHSLLTSSSCDFAGASLIKSNKLKEEKLTYNTNAHTTHTPSHAILTSSSCDFAGASLIRSNSSEDTSSYVHTHVIITLLTHLFFVRFRRRVVDQIKQFVFRKQRRALLFRLRQLASTGVNRADCDTKQKSEADIVKVR
jgi:hypothetical protein